MSKLRVIVYGLGAVGRRAARIAYEKGAEIVAVYVRTKEGKEFTAPELLGAEVCTPDMPFERFEADVLLMTHGSAIGDIHAVALRAARAGLDVVSVSNEAYDPFMPSDEVELAREIDRAFRDAGKSMLACGVQDSFWFCQPLGLSLAAGRIDEVIGECTADMGLFGEAATAKVPIGLTEAEFVAQGHTMPNGHGIFDIAMRPLMRGLNLSMEQSSREVRPYIAPRDLTLKSGRVILAGTTRGFVDTATFTTKEGITFTGNFYVTYLYLDETAVNEWVIRGEPSLNMRTDHFPGDEITAAVVVNRIPDVIAARPGVLSVDEMPEGRYHHRLARA